MLLFVGSVWRSRSLFADIQQMLLLPHRNCYVEESCPIEREIHKIVAALRDPALFGQRYEERPHPNTSRIVKLTALQERKLAQAVELGVLLR